MKTFSPIRTDNETLNRVQDGIKSVLNLVTTVEILDGLLTSSLAITTTATKFAHGLGRKPMGWFLVAPDADARVWQTASDDTTVTLRSSAAVNAKLWVF